MVLLPFVAAALANPIITVVPAHPLNGASSQDVPVQANGVLPAGQEFSIRMPIAAPAGGGDVHIWPMPYGQDCGSATEPEARPGARQDLRFAMSPGGDGDYLEASIPPLQVGASYCLAIHVNWPVKPEDWLPISANAAAAAFDDSAVCGAADGGKAALARELHKAFDGSAVKANANGIEDAIQSAQSSATATSPGACDKWIQAAGQTRQDTDGFADNQKSAANARDGLRSTPAVTASFPSPLVFAAGRLTLVSVLVKSKGVDETQIAAAHAQLAAVLDDASSAAWGDLLAAVVNADDDASQVQALKELRKLTTLPAPPASGLFIYDNDNRRIPVGEWLKNPDQASLPAQSAADQLKQVAPYAGTDRAAVDALQKKISDYAQILGTSAAFPAMIKADGKAERLARDEFIKAISQALAKDDVRAKLGYATQRVRSTLGPTGGYKTPAAANYVSPQGGIAVAYPIVDGATDFVAWPVPYAAASIYFVPVDRTIAIDQLVGNPFLQRFSLMVGAALNGTDLAIPGRAVRPAFGTTAPIAGASMRITDFMNVTAGAVLYRIADPSAASSVSTIYAAPFAALSVDADLIDLITKATTPN